MIRLLQSPPLVLCLGLLAYGLTTAALLVRSGLHRPAPPTSNAAAPPPEAKPSWAFRNPELEQLIEDLQREKKRLDEREQQLNALAQRLQHERQEINLVTQSVHQLQRDFDQQLVRVREEEVANLKRLAKIYGAMAPDAASTILKELPDEQIVKILAFLKENESAPILETLSRQGDPEAKRAALLSERLRVVIARATPPKKTGS